MKNQNSILNQLLDVDPIGVNRFLGHRLEGSTGRVFGGQVLGQALMAAAKTVDEDRLVHSSHNYFIRPGDTALPIHYEVFLDLDGRSFSNRRVVASQNGKPILNLIASFQTPTDAGLNHQHEMPDVPDPETLLSDEELAEKYKDQIPDSIYQNAVQEGPIEVRPLNDAAHFLVQPASLEQVVWFRARGQLNEGRAFQRAVLSYASDNALLSTCMRPHEFTWTFENLRSASIDHALWIHGDIQFSDWHLYVMDTPWSGHARGLNRGSIFSADGKLVASVAQEGLIRLTGK